MNLRFLRFSVTILVINQNISDLIALLTFLSIDKRNLAIKIFEHQVNHTKLLLRAQMLKENMYTPLTTVTKKRQHFLGFSI